jgi:hypothetical protein
MAVTAGAVAVDTTVGGKEIVPAPNPNYSQSQGGYQLPNRSIFLSNGSGATVYLGPHGVTTLTGYPMAASTTLQIELHLDEAIYGIVSSTGSTVSFLASGS